MHIQILECQLLNFDEVLPPTLPPPVHTYNHNVITQLTYLNPPLCVSAVNFLKQCLSVPMLPQTGSSACLHKLETGPAWVQCHSCKVKQKCGMYTKPTLNI